MQDQDKTRATPVGGQIHGDPNFKANLWNQAIVEELNSATLRGKFRKWLQNKGKGSAHPGADDSPGQRENG